MDLHDNAVTGDDDLVMRYPALILRSEIFVFASRLRHGGSL